MKHSLNFKMGNHKALFDLHAHVHDSPSSFVFTVRELLRGPLPALVLAATVETYDVYGFKPLTMIWFKLVVREMTCCDSPGR